VIDNDAAHEQLAPLVDGWLLHNRPIQRRCDDSVTFIAHLPDQPTFQAVRRSRGYAPLPVLLPPELPLAAPGLATGGDLKNVAALGVERLVFLTQHIGDLRHPDARLELGRTVADFEQLFRIRPQFIAADTHPDYAARRYAAQRAAAEGVPLIEVQHHHAHIAACAAENGVTGPVIGLSFDGAGYGLDGHIWGGEGLLADLSDFERIYHLEYLPLPGGDAAVRRPYRLAAAYLLRLLPEVDPGAYLPDIPAAEIQTIAAMLRADLHTPLTSSMGRLFDAVSALLGLTRVATYEAQAAIALEAVALRSQATGRYSLPLDGDCVRLGPLFTAITADIRAGAPIPDIARRFHHGVAQLAVDLACALQAVAGQRLPVALSGGVWQNRLLLELTAPQLRAAGFSVLLPRQVPANDGGLAFGQMAVAAARLARTS
jgi:hydrogenase maturation protein HypF